MAKIERTGEVTGKSPSEVYESAVEVFEASGYNVWKKRPIAYLAMVRISVDGYGVEGNFAARFTSPTSYILTLTSEEMLDNQLAKVADTFISALNEKFSG